ncbi:ParA family partition ATPase [Halovulum sp. GXIMD14793]
MGIALTFAQQKGGAGKTTLVAHLARAWQQAGKSVILIDLDPQRSLSAWNNLRGDDAFDLRQGAGWRAGPDIREANAQADIVLVDCPGNASDLLQAALRESAMVVIPCQPSALDIWATDPILEMAAKEKTAARIVLNRVPPRGTHVDDATKALKNQEAQVLKSCIGNRIVLASQMGRGQTAFEQSGKTRAKAELTALRKELDRHVKKVTA